MVIPGVNGSVLASAYQQSKLRRRFNQGGPVKPYANLWAVSPQGDFNYQAGVNKGPLSARVTGSTNVPNLRQNFLEPSLSMNAGPANIGFTPRGVSAGIGGGNAYLQGSADYSGETASVQGGVFGQKFGVNADAFLDKSKYVDAGVTASYNVAPGLAVEGSYRYNNFEGPSQDYFLGARYSRRFKEGGRRETSTEENPDRIEPIEITSKRAPWYQRLPRQVADRMGFNPYGYDTNPNDFGSQLARRIAQSADSPGGAFLGALSAPFATPQLGMMYGLTGEVQTPSEYMDIQNPVGAFITDSVLDPFVLNAAANSGVKAAKNLARSVEVYPELFSRARLGIQPKPVGKTAGFDFTKAWTAHPEYAKRYNNYAPVKSGYFGNDMQRFNLQQLDDYQPKSYQDLLYDKGVPTYKDAKKTSSGRSYGEPAGIYVDHNPSWLKSEVVPEIRKRYLDASLASTETHELSHLTDGNGRFLTDLEIQAIDEAVPNIPSQSGNPFDISNGTTPSYFTEPTEVRARMMEARQLWGMTPDQEFTPEMYDWVMDQHNWFGMGPYIKDKNKFINLMNTMRAVPAIGAAGYGASQITQQKLGGRLQQAYMKGGGKHGGLDRWFAEKWVDVKSGKPCGRQEGEDRAYPACRPSRRVSSQTPKTSSEMSSQEKAKFKATKTSSERIPYNHKRK